MKFPKEGDDHSGCEWIKVFAQAVPAHVGSPSPGCGYEEADPFAAFLPPAVKTDSEGDPAFPRAVAIVTEHSLKGTERNGQEYICPFLVLTGEEYPQITYQELHERISDALRGNRSPIVAEIFTPDGGHKIIRGWKKPPR